MGRNLLRVKLFAVILFARAAALANKGCKNIQSRCAICSRSAAFNRGSTAR